jgi:anaerobic magnesium-protoporphyrin IX monomethyl ester cyclase
LPEQTSGRRKIILIEPPYYRLFKDSYSMDRHPLALGYLSGTIRTRTDWDVVSYNADFRPGGEMLSYGHLAGKGFYNYLESLRTGTGGVWSEIESTIEAERPSVIGISAKSQNFKSALIVARLAKKADPGILTVIGGPHVSMVGKSEMKNKELDICVVGEGENTIVDLLGALDEQKDLAEIPGLIIRDGEKVIETGKRELIEDLDELCFPHGHAPELLKDYEKYPLSAFKNIFATRGCPYNCFFCGSREIWTRRPRFRSIENVTAEIRELQSKGLDSIHFDDDTFGINRKYLFGLCDAIARDCPGLRWSSEIHVNLIDDEVVGAMKKAGCYRIHLGIESGNDSILAAIRKGFTFEKALDACRTIRKHGITLSVFMMIGFPQDTEETLNDTINAIKKIDCDSVVFSIFTPYPGTEAFSYCMDQGLIKEDLDVSLFNHQSPANYFCGNISPERFRSLSVRTARTVDRLNTMKRIRMVFSTATLARIGRLGIKGSLRKGKKLFLHR